METVKGIQPDQRVSVATGNNGKGSTTPEDGPENFLLSERIDMPLESPEWVIQHLWPARTIGLFTGDGGEGKTHFALQLLVAIASGGGIEGTRFRCPTAREVVYITQEDEADFVVQELRIQHPELKGQTEVCDRIRVISTALKGENLFVRNPNSQEYIIKNLPEGCVFVLDSWSTFIQCDENHNTELLKEITALREIMKKTQATPLLIHHRPKPNPQTGWQSSFRGGTALPNNCRFHILMEKNGARLSFEKVSRGAKPSPLCLTFDKRRMLFVPTDEDEYVAAFKVREKLTTSEVMERLGKDPQNKDERKKITGALNYRKDRIAKIKKEKSKQDAVWKRIK